MGAGKTSTKKCAKCEFQVWFLFRSFFSDATAEERDEVSYKGNNFCYKACPVANSFFCLTHTHIHSRTEQQSGKERHSARSSCTFAWLHLGIFFLSLQLLAFRFQRIKWHEIKSYYENFCAAFAGKREKL